VGRRARGRYREALRRHDFRLLIVAFVVDRTGSWAYSVVLAIYVFDRTGSPQWLAAVSASRWVTGVIVSGFAGIVADRYDRKRVMQISAILSAAVMTAMSVLVGANGPLTLLLALSAVSTVVASPYGPAAGALTPQTVSEDELAAANALFATFENLVVVVGPGIGGLLLLTGKPVLGIALNALSFVVAAIIVTRLRVESTTSVAHGDNALVQFTAGLKVLSRHRVALVLMLYSGLTSAIYGASTVIFVPLSQQLGTGTTGYSYLIAGAALGSVLAAGVAGRLSGSPRLAPVIVVSIGVNALPFLVTVWVHSPPLAFALQLISGTGMVVVDVLALTALQRDLPRDVLSRVLGVYDIVVFAATVSASFGAAVLLSHGGLHPVLISIGVAFPLVALIGLPALLRADRESAGVVSTLRPRVELLGALDLFAGVDRPALERLAGTAEQHQVPVHTVVIREGDTAEALWVLVAGSLSVCAMGDRSTVRQLPTVEAPGYVGELGLIHGVVRTATVRAREPSTLLRIAGSEFLSVLETAPASTTRFSLAGARMARTT
jgi:MFS family permease